MSRWSLVASRDDAAATVSEMRRGLDYLHSRPDVDGSRVSVLAISAGSGPGVLVAGLDSRYRAVIFVGSGVVKSETEYAPAASRVNFGKH